MPRGDANPTPTCRDSERTKCGREACKTEGEDPTFNKFTSRRERPERSGMRTGMSPQWGWGALSRDGEAGPQPRWRAPSTGSSREGMFWKQLEKSPAWPPGGFWGGLCSCTRGGCEADRGVDGPRGAHAPAASTQCGSTCRTPPGRSTVPEGASGRRAGTVTLEAGRTCGWTNINRGEGLQMLCG